MGKTHNYSWQSPVPKQVPLLWITIQVSLPGTTFRFWISISGRLARCYFRLPTSSSVIRAEASWDPDWSRRPGALTEAPFGKMAPASGNDGEFVVSKHARKAFTGCQERRADGMGMPSNAQQCPESLEMPRDAQRWRAGARFMFAASSTERIVSRARMPWGVEIKLRKCWSTRRLRLDGCE